MKWIAARGVDQFDVGKRNDAAVVIDLRAGIEQHLGYAADRNVIGHGIASERERRPRDVAGWGEEVLLIAAIPKLNPPPGRPIWPAMMPARRSSRPVVRRDRRAAPTNSW